MAISPRTRVTSPHLALHFGIVVSAFVSVVLIALVLEQLGVDDRLLRVTSAMAPLLVLIGVALATASNEPHELMAAGRRIPAVYNGVAIAVTASGGVGIVCLNGAVFLSGFDALALVTGWCAGLVAMAVLIAPFVRKAGAYTLPGYLGRRFASPTLRVVAALLVSVPLLLLVQAEVTVASRLLLWLVDMPEAAAQALLLGAVAVMLAAGGMRSLTWASVALGLIGTVALLVPVAVIGALETNLPLPQLSQGPLVRTLGRLELAGGLVGETAPALAITLPPDGLAPILGGLVKPFTTMGPAAYVLLSLTLMFGIAVLPTLFARAGTASSVYEARKAAGWSLFILSTLLLSAVVSAVFMRDRVLGEVLAQGSAQMPDWYRTLLDSGHAGLLGKSSDWTLARLGFRRDSVIAMLPLAAGFPAVAIYSVITGAIAIAAAAIAATLQALAAIWAEDVVAGYRAEPPSDGPRALALRGALVVACLAVAASLRATPGDPLALTVWAIAILASTLFPVVVLSIWWKRIGRWPALAAMLTGFTVSTGIVLAGKGGFFGLDGTLAAVVGVPTATLVAIAGSLLSPATTRAALGYVRDIRVPGGETVYDRETRLLRLKRMREP
jgi:cation/acetate symporter